MTSQLRIYTINKGKLDEFVTGILHVEDSYELDVVGARSAGMRAVLLDRSGKLPSGDCETIKSLLALSDLLN